MLSLDVALVCSFKPLGTSGSNSSSRNQFWVKPTPIQPSRSSYVKRCLYSIIFVLSFAPPLPPAASHSGLFWQRITSAICASSQQRQAATKDSSRPVVAVSAPLPYLWSSSPRQPSGSLSHGWEVWSVIFFAHSLGHCNGSQVSSKHKPIGLTTRSGDQGRSYSSFGSYNQ